MFNAHLIHLDKDWAQLRRGYPGQYSYPTLHPCYKTFDFRETGAWAAYGADASRNHHVLQTHGGDCAFRI